MCFFCIFWFTCLYVFGIWGCVFGTFGVQCILILETCLKVLNQDFLRHCWFKASQCEEANHTSAILGNVGGFRTYHHITSHILDFRNCDPSFYMCSFYSCPKQKTAPLALDMLTKDLDCSRGPLYVDSRGISSLPLCLHHKPCDFQLNWVDQRIG